MMFKLKLSSLVINNGSFKLNFYQQPQHLGVQLIVLSKLLLGTLLKLIVNQHQERNKNANINAQLI